MIKIISTHKYPCKSTFDAVALCNALNDINQDATYYGLDIWYPNQCKCENLEKFKLKKRDRVIVIGEPITDYTKFFKIKDHIRKLHSTKKLTIRRRTKEFFIKAYNKFRGMYLRRFHDIKFILSVSDSSVTHPKKINFYDKTHYLCRELNGFQEKNYFICPPISHKTSIAKNDNNISKRAAITADICESMGIEESISKAMEDRVDEVIIYGYMKDPFYFYSKLEPIMKNHPGVIKFAGNVTDYNVVFDGVTDVYCHPKNKIASNIGYICDQYNVSFHSNKNVYQYDQLDLKEILDIWIRELKA
jgi:hypothetical protein